ncbi:GNAT family N-acetyltransferase [Mangrovihabitans endophyticus]|uniref:N-acetyltransferase n=1 Tax=Mangrovihabitans endophyticus TaxID=1751298 RepID=A0A8J3FQ59_9ACTN|nr:GNAT family N-acetyltransferase [Mangrovihabitans endophyticus]GGL00795.1 N-acetyltransferase [Mangrovihabitans endophyticus]
MRVALRPANAAEADTLSQLALRSKSHWGYDKHFLDACRADLTLSPDEIVARRAVVAEIAGQVVGFYTLDGEPPEGEIGNLWVEPTRMRHGIGRLLWHRAVTAGREIGFRSLLIDADPHAEGFYLAMGAVRVGDSPSSAMPGRLLPRLRAVVSA